MDCPVLDRLYRSNDYHYTVLVTIEFYDCRGLDSVVVYQTD